MRAGQPIHLGDDERIKKAVREQDGQACGLEVSLGEMREHLERVLLSEAFARSARMQRFLRFLCEESMEGRSGALKEYTIALAVFDKPDDFDPGTSAVVRVEAGRLRRLLQKYSLESGQRDRILLSVPKGSYSPKFERRLVEEGGRGFEQKQMDGNGQEPSLSETLLGGERRLITVVSCSMGDAVIQNVATDDAYLNAFDQSYELCMAIAKRHGGSIDSGAGDRVIIYFGWPELLEDAAGRAMTASLEILAILSESCRDYGGVRIAVASSSVVARSSTKKPWIVGNAPAVAAKALAQAVRDSILVSESTRRLSRTAFEMVPAGRIEGAGHDDSLLWRLLRPKVTRSRHLQGSPSVRSVLIGRHEETELLLSRWRLAMAGEGQTVIIEGEAGIGKSKLAETVLAQVASQSARVRLQCSPHHLNSALYPCTELLKRLLGRDLTESNAPQRVTKLLDGLGLHSPLNQALLENLLFQRESGTMKALPASQKKELTVQLLIRMVEAKVLSRPTVMLVEDIHWIDPTTTEVIEKLVAGISEEKLLLIMTGRPGSSASLARYTNVTLLRLSRLAKADCSLLVERLSSMTPLAPTICAAIIKKAEGIPLYLEELTKLFLASNVDVGDQIIVPESLTDLLSSQLARLGEARAVAQVASVIGRDFSSELLGAVTGERQDRINEALDQLVAARVLIPSRGDERSRFSFRHALLRDAVYSSILEADRKELHHRTGTVLVESFPEIASDHPNIIAIHMRDSAHYDEAVPFWVDAGRKAVARYELQEGIANFRSALTDLAKGRQIDERPERELEILLGLGFAIRSAYGYFDPQLQSIYTRARELAETLRRPSALASAIYGLWTCAAGRGDWPVAARLAETFKQHCSTTDDNEHAEIEANRLLGASAALRGQFALARHHFEQAVRLYDVDRHGPTYGFDPGAVSMAYLAWMSWHLCEDEDSYEFARGALAIAEVKAHPPTLALVLSYLILHAVCDRNLEVIFSYNVRLQALCDERECRYWRPFGAACAEWAEFQRDGQPGHLQRLLGHTEDFQERYLISCLQLLGAEICDQLGLVRQGLDLVADAERFIEEHEERVWEARCVEMKAALLLKQSPGDITSYASHIARARGIARRQGALRVERSLLMLTEEPCSGIKQRSLVRDVGPRKPS